MSIINFLNSGKFVYFCLLKKNIPENALSFASIFYIISSVQNSEEKIRICCNYSQFKKFLESFSFS